LLKNDNAEPPFFRNTAPPISATPRHPFQQPRALLLSPFAYQVIRQLVPLSVAYYRTSVVASSCLRIKLPLVLCVQTHICAATHKNRHPIMRFSHGELGKEFKNAGAMYQAHRNNVLAA
jgi:hypothetical protein